MEKKIVKMKMPPAYYNWKEEGRKRLSKEDKERLRKDLEERRARSREWREREGL